MTYCIHIRLAGDAQPWRLYCDGYPGPADAFAALEDARGRSFGSVAGWCVIPSGTLP